MAVSHLWKWLGITNAETVRQGSSCFPAGVCFLLSVSVSAGFGAGQQKQQHVDSGQSRTRNLRNVSPSSHARQTAVNESIAGHIWGNFGP